MTTTTFQRRLNAIEAGTVERLARLSESLLRELTDAELRYLIDELRKMDDGPDLYEASESELKSIIDTAPPPTLEDVQRSIKLYMLTLAETRGEHEAKQVFLRLAK